MEASAAPAAAAAAAAAPAAAAAAAQVPVTRYPSSRHRSNALPLHHSTSTAPCAHCFFAVRPLGGRSAAALAAAPSDLGELVQFTNVLGGFST
ncbi:MAG: hypothetical protein ABGY10_13495, partial [bacterium]